MKIKKIKLLKALALTGAFGIVATVPVIVSSCSSTSDNNGGSNNNGNGDNQQQTELTPALKSNVNLQGKLTGIYDTNTTDRKNTSTLIVADMKANPDNYFTNGNEIKEGIQSSEITVDGGFSTTSSWDGDAYDTWKTGATQVMYPTAAPQINIASLNDLKETTFKDETAINKFFTDASLSESVKDVTGLNVANKLHLENGDLLHVNVKGTKTDKSEVKIDLQIPVSNLNLKTTLKVSIKGGTNIKEVTDLETSFSYNIGIDATLNFTQTKGTAPEVTSSDVSDEAAAAKAILKKLGYTTGSDDAIDNDKISAALGIYNCKFTAKTAKVNDKETPNAEVTGSNKVYTVTVTATPYDSTYVWDDGAEGGKDISFDVSLNLK